MIEKPSRVSTWKKKKHRKDYDNVKGGFQGGNKRYDRNKADHRTNIAMGKARSSRF